MNAIPVAVILALLAGAPPEADLYERVREAQKCKSATYAPDLMDCHYDLGPLHFYILNVGSSAPAVVVKRLDEKAGFGINFDVSTGCVMVSGWFKSGPIPPAELNKIAVWVSPVTGGVYRSPAGCISARNR